MSHSPIEFSEPETPFPERTVVDLLPHQLCEYVKEKHHGYLRSELPRLHALSERVARVHGPHTASLVEVFHVFHQMAGNLMSHIAEEEDVLFPLITSLNPREVRDPASDGPVERMLQKHEEAGASLARLRELTNGYQPPPDACNTYRALFAGLRELEVDLHRHIRLEDSVFFPATHPPSPRTHGA